ncbi:common central domain of tyrosinase-domain-containing protein [Hypoxylon crocopeplum]|nr:common central domain of tyrosinase-domain-containing protein [Hypoxylon crocopeplum]
MKALRNPPLYPRNPFRHMDPASRLRYIFQTLAFLIFSISIFLAGGVALKYTALGSSWSLTVPKLFGTHAHYQPHYQHVRVVGAKAGINHVTGSLPPRLELSEFTKSAYGVDLYLQCHLELLNKDASDKLSYYQIAAIHGGPYKPWDNVTGNTTFPSGYATHRSVLFPVWHRPYLALFEQVISECAVKLAYEYDEDVRVAYQDAANVLRIPYWDWAAKPWLPDIVAMPFRIVQTPRGPVNMSNPLYRYTFPDGTIEGLRAAASIHKEDPIIWTTGATMRCPQLADHNQTVSDQLRALNTTLKTYQLFTEIGGDYEHFASIGYWDVHHRISLENVHNAIHLAVGTEMIIEEGAEWARSHLCGHMGSDFASFDPLFFLHHANIDRIFALWQAVFPDSYVTPQISDLGTYLRPANLTDTIDTPLYPFFGEDRRTPYTAETARNVSTFGYTYPELLDLTMSPSELKEHVLQAVSNLYDQDA